MENYSETLRNIRMEISRKLKEINDLNNYNMEVWEKIEKECNENSVFFKKQTDEKVVKFKLMDMGGEFMLSAFFDSNPSAKELSVIEEHTGLKFYDKKINEFYFKLE